MWNIGGALLGGLLGNQSSTQGSTSTVQPYSGAQPYINQTINSGMNLQKQYQANPLSLGQIGAYANSQGLSDGFRAQAPDLISQMNSMKQFDRNDPTAKPTQFSFNSAPVDTQATQNTILSSLPAQSLGLLANQAIANKTGIDVPAQANGYRPIGESWYQTTTPEERTQFFNDNPTLAWISRLGIQGFQALNPYSLNTLQEKQTPGITQQYLNETQGNSSSGGGNAGWSSMGGLSLGDSNRSAIAAANGYGGGV